MQTIRGITRIRAEQPLLLLVVAVGMLASQARAEFTNRYPKISGFNHQIYVEGYELPVLNAGPADPAVSPDGQAVAVAAGGHLWLIPLTAGGAAGPARRLTGGPALDSRPAWSPDGRTLAAVRDTGTDTHIVRIELAAALARYAAAPEPARGSAPAPASALPGSAGQTESVLVDTPALDLDPCFSADGRWLYYSSAVAGDLDLWRLELATGKSERLTRAPGLELRPLPLPDGKHVVFLTKQRSGADTVSLLSLGDGSERVLLRESIASLLRPALSPDGRRLALNLPDAASRQDLWRLWAYDLANAQPAAPIAANVQPATANVQGGTPPAASAPPAAPTAALEGRLAQLGPPVALGTVAADAGRPLRPLTPAFTADGSAVLFAAPDADHRFHLYRAPLDGRAAHELAPPRWGEEPSATLTIRTVRAGAAQPVPARLHIEAGDGHPLLPRTGIVRLDSQSGLTYVYSDGTLTLAVPPGIVRVAAARGLAAPLSRAEATLRAGERRTVTLTLAPVFDAAAAGYVAADLHFHLNYGGPYSVGPTELRQILRAEEVDVATPMVANLHNRLSDLELWPEPVPGRGPAPGLAPGRSPASAAASPATEPLPVLAARPLIVLAQEVRSHFLGHLGVVGVATPVWPFYWGPGYPVYGREDRLNADVLKDTRQRGGVGSYVHPVAIREPLAGTATAAPGAAIPLMLIADAVLGDLDALEVACLWSDELGTSAVWQRLLSLGLPVALSAGTDAMVNVHRNMAVGSARIYVRHAGPLTLPSYLEALRAGRSVVSTGPFLELSVAGKRPGEVLADAAADANADANRSAAAPREVDFELAVAAAMPLARVEVLVNGEVAWSSPADAPVLAGPGRTRLRGRVRVPAGGFVLARAAGKGMQWPGMDSYPFALTGPVWLGRVGSVDPAVRRAAAAELLLALGSAESRLRAAFSPEQAPRLHGRLAAARARLTALLQAR